MYSKLPTVQASLPHLYLYLMFLFQTLNIWVVHKERKITRKLVEILIETNMCVGWKHKLKEKINVLHLTWLMMNE